MSFYCLSTISFLKTDPYAKNISSGNTLFFSFCAGNFCDYGTETVNISENDIKPGLFNGL